MKTIFSFFTLLVCAFSLQAHALVGGDGYDHGNGGDICEKRFQEVSEDLKSWILKGGAENLKLPAEISYEAYLQGMLGKIETTKVSCVDEEVFIGEAEKTCVNFTEANGDLRIECNRKRFTSTPDADQYVLVHHEYAGLAGFEKNTGEASDYEISEQLSGYLENEIVKKLVVKPSSAGEKDPFNPSSCTDTNMTSEEAFNTFSVKESATVATFSIYTRERWCNNPEGCGEWKTIPNQVTYYDSNTSRKFMMIPDNGTVNYLTPANMDPSITLTTTQEFGMGLYMSCKLGGKEAVCSVSTTPFLQKIGEAHGVVGAHCARLDFHPQGFFADRAFFESELIFKNGTGLIPDAPWVERESVIFSRY